MTREQALSIKILTFDFEENPIEEPLPSEMILVVNSIYDSLGTQTCKSCKHKNIEIGFSGEMFCESMHFWLAGWENFGCNKFMEKDK